MYSRCKLQASFDGSPAIVCKIDWYSVIFHNMTMYEVISALYLDEILSDDCVELFNSRFFHSYGYGSDMRMTWHGISFHIKNSELYDIYKCFSLDLVELDGKDIFNRRMHDIQVEISGSSLDYMRSIGIDIDNLVFQRWNIPDCASYHLTRVDYAYDLLNYMGNFVDLCIAACNLYKNSNNLIHTTGSNRPISWEAKTGNQNTLYLGKAGSNKQLRIYDKKMQYERARKFVTDCPYFGIDEVSDERILPDTWVRIELQTRRVDVATDLIMRKNSSFESIFRYIYDHFAIKEGTGIHIPVCDFWRDLFDWSVLPLLIQNANCVVVVTDPYERAVEYIEKTALGSIMVFLSTVGPDAFLNYINNLINSMQQHSSGVLRWDRIYQRCLETNHGIIPPFLKRRKSGVYYISSNSSSDSFYSDLPILDSIEVDNNDHNF